MMARLFTLLLLCLGFSAAAQDLLFRSKASGGSSGYLISGTSLQKTKTEFQGRFFFGMATDMQPTHYVYSIGEGETNPTPLIPTGNVPIFPQWFTPLGNRLLFAAGEVGAQNNVELWQTNGSSQGTSKVAELRPGTLGSAPSLLTPMGNWVYFLANDGGIFPGLFRSDGTPAGTRKLTLPHTGNFSPPKLMPFGNALYYTHNGSLYRITDTLVARVSGNLVNDVTIESATDLQIFKNRLVFVARRSGQHGAGRNTGNELFYLKPEGDSLALLLDVEPGPIGGTSLIWHSTNKTLYFSYRDAGFTKLGSLDSSNPTVLRNVMSHVGQGDVNNGFFVQVDSNAVFLAQDGSPNGIQLYSSTGVGATALTSGPSNAIGFTPAFPLTLVHNQLYFLNPTDNSQLWQTNGTPAGTQKVNVRPELTIISNEPAQWNNRLVVMGSSQITGDEFFIFRQHPLDRLMNGLSARTHIWHHSGAQLLANPTNTNRFLINNVAPFETLTNDFTSFNQPQLVLTDAVGRRFIRFLPGQHFTSFISNRGQVMSTVLAQRHTSFTLVRQAGAQTAPQSTIWQWNQAGGGLPQTMLGLRNGSMGYHVQGSTALCTVGSATQGIAAHPFVLYTTVADNGKTLFYRNGVLVDSQTIACTPALSMNFFMVGNASSALNNTGVFAGDVGEIMLMDTVFNASTRRQMQLWVALRNRAGQDTVRTVEVGSRKGIFVMDSLGIAIDVYENNDPDGLAQVAVQRQQAIPTVGAGFGATGAMGTTGQFVTPLALIPLNGFTVTAPAFTQFKAALFIHFPGLSQFAGNMVLVKRNNAQQPWQALPTQRMGDYLYAEGITSFSEFGIGSADATLPVLWAGQSIADAGQCHPLIQWKAGGEGVMSYQLQRSTDGRNFETVATVGAQGSGVQTHRWNSATAQPASLLWRIVASMQNGSRQQGPVLHWRCGAATAVVKLASNVVSGEAWLLGGEAGTRYQVRLCNALGQTIYQQPAAVLPLRISIPSGARGLHYVQVLGGETPTHLQLMIR